MGRGATSLICVCRANIQGDGRKFLGHFRRHCGSHISSESFKQGHDSYLVNEANISSEFVNVGVLNALLLLFCRHQHSGSVHGYSETRSRSNNYLKGAYAHLDIII